MTLLKVTLAVYLVFLGIYIPHFLYYTIRGKNLTVISRTLECFRINPFPSYCILIEAEHVTWLASGNSLLISKTLKNMDSTLIWDTFDNYFPFLSHSTHLSNGGWTKLKYDGECHYKNQKTLKIWIQHQYWSLSTFHN